MKKIVAFLPEKQITKSLLARHWTMRKTARVFGFETRLHSHILHTFNLLKDQKPNLRCSVITYTTYCVIVKWQVGNLEIQCRNQLANQH